MLFFLSKGYRVVAHDRRGHGRSEQVDERPRHRPLRGRRLRRRRGAGSAEGGPCRPFHRGGEVARYVARHGEPAGRVAKAVLVAAIPPLMLKTDDNPEGTPMEVFDDFRTALAGNRAQFFRDVPSGPFYGFNRDGRRSTRASSRTGGGRA
jgi:non-heme chloroperoxidase